MKTDTTKLTIRPFEFTDFDYTAAVDLVNRAWPDDPETVEQWKENDKKRNPKDLKLRFIGEIEQENAKKIVAYGSIDEWSKRPGKYIIDFDIDKYL